MNRLTKIKLLEKPWFTPVLLGGALAVGLASYGRPPSLLMPISYACLGFVAGVLAWKAISRIKWIPAGVVRKCATAFLIISVLGLMAAWDRYDVCQDDKNTFVTYRRWGDVPIKSTGLRNGGFWSGPLSPSGKKHGRWEFLSIRERTYVWYWYGEEVTEGEFHRYQRGR